MATKTEIRNKALRMLGVLGAGRSASGPQAADIDAAYDEVYASLEELNLVEWASDADIPSQFVEPVVALVASSRVTEYNISEARSNRIMNKAASAEAAIRRLVANDHITTTTKFVDY